MNIKEFIEGKEKYLAVQGDCLEGMKGIPDGLIHSVCTDPPYGLSNGVDISEVMRCWIIGKRYEHNSTGFFGAVWDSFIPGPEYWKEIYRILKPGGHVLAFSSARTFDLLSMALRFAGFENRDTIIHQYGFELNILSWIYRSGMNHGQNVSRMIDDYLGAIPEKSGTSRKAHRRPSGIVDAGGGHSKDTMIYEYLNPVTDEAKKWKGWNTTLKPAHEVILVFRKPLSEKTIAENVLKHGTGVLNVDACHVGNEKRWSKQADNDGTSSCSYMTGKTGYEGKYVEGRWPPNFVATHTPQCTEISCVNECPCRKLQECDNGETFPRFDWDPAIDFFPFNYVAKASTEERNIGCDELPKKSIREEEGDPENWDLTPGTVRSRLVTKPQANTHVSIKPINIMKWLVKLVTPPNGIVIDPFAGSFSTGLACLVEGFRFIGFEMDENYYKIGCARMKYVEELVNER